MATRLQQPSWTTTRKTFLVGLVGGALALAVGRPWSPRGRHVLSVDALRPRRADNLRETSRGRDVELLPLPVDPHGPIFRLNRSAALVWRGVDGRRSVSDLAALVASTYGIAATAARADTLECLRALSGAGLVFGVFAPGGAAGRERA
jgi:hypothetical protein